MPIFTQKAENIIKEAFADKTDKAGAPYTGHLFRVRESVKANGGDHELQCIALLHDLLEDCSEWNIERLGKHFSVRVVEGVKALTKADNQPYSDYLAKLSDNSDAVMVKLADLKDNMDLSRLRTPQKSDYQRVAKYKRAFKFLSSLG